MRGRASTVRGGHLSGAVSAPSSVWRCAMVAEADLQAYRDEVRRQVCEHCPERPEGGPPCGPRGKPCGVELHLPRLVEAVHEVHSELLEPYRDHSRQKVCAGCAF